MTPNIPQSVPPVSRVARLKAVLAPALLVVACGGLAASLLLPTPSVFRRAPQNETAERLEIPLPEFAFTERSGVTVTKQSLLGKVWVASFVFTRCTGPCPSVTATMARLQADLDLARHDDLRLVTFTVDPGRDGPRELKAYADNFRADPERWLFLTGREDELHAVMKGGFKMGVTRSEKATPIEGQEFDHSTFVVAVDRRGNVRGHFDGYQGPNDEGGERFTQRYADLKKLVEELRQE